MSSSVNLHTNIFRPIIITIHLVAILPALFRLIYRAHIRRLWWDDFWAFIAMLCDFLLLVCYGVFSSVRDPSTVAFNFVNIGSFLSVTFGVWTARISVAVTIVRLLATAGCIRIVSQIMATIFFLFSLACMLQTLLICGPPDTAKFLCTNPALPGYFELSVSIIADLWLLSAPAYLLWNMNLSKRHYRLIQAIFACEILVTVVSMVHAAFVIQQKYVQQAYTAHFEAALSLIVCNLLFLVTYIYRIFHNGDEHLSSSGDSGEDSSSRSNKFERETSLGPMAESSFSALTSSFLTTMGSGQAISVDNGERAFASEVCPSSC